MYPFLGAIYRTCFLDLNTLSMVSGKKSFTPFGGYTVGNSPELGAYM